MNSSGNDPIRNLPLVTEPRRADRPAATWQVLLTAFGLIAIVTVFFWGLNNQRDETAGNKPQQRCRRRLHRKAATRSKANHRVSSRHSSRSNHPQQPARAPATTTAIRKNSRKTASKRRAGGLPRATTNPRNASRSENYPNIDEMPKPSVALTTASIAWN